LLDVGCGAGEPISNYLIEQNYAVTGIDASPAMIEICESRFPEEAWLVMDMRELHLNRQFDGIVAWDSFFHLDPNEQRSALRSFIRHLRPGGALLLTVGDEAGEVLGSVEGEAVYHSSLAQQEYEQILGSAGFKDIEMILNDEICDRTVLLAKQYNCI
jgi:SAM-dependent methyltransferase